MADPYQLSQRGTPTYLPLRSGSYLDNQVQYENPISAVLEPAATVASGLAAMIPAGYAGLVDPGWGEEVQQDLTYIPRSEAGIGGLQAFADSAPMNAIQGIDDWWKDTGVDAALAGLRFASPFMMGKEPTAMERTLMYMTPAVLTTPKTTIMNMVNDTVKGVNKAHRSLKAPGSHQMNMETSTAFDPQDKITSIRNYQAAVARAKHNRPDLVYDKTPPVGQGVWSGEGQMQYNPVIMDDYGRFQPEEVQSMLDTLDQYGAGVARFRPQLIPHKQSANILQVSGVDDDWIKSIGKGYTDEGRDAVVFAQPDNRALIFNATDDTPGGLGQLLNSPYLRGKGKKYGIADDIVDRAYVHDKKSAAAVGRQPKPEYKSKFQGKRVTPDEWNAEKSARAKSAGKK